MNKNETKVMFLKLWTILQKFSDEDAALSTNDLLDYLSLQNISCDRRTLYKSIKLLNDNGFEILCRKSKTCNYYYVVDRRFDLSELRILIDSVQGSCFITRRKTNELVAKLADLAGKNKAGLLKRNVTQFNTTKHQNEHIYYSVYSIGEAILTHRRISFRYFDYGIDGSHIYRKDGDAYIVNPLTTVFSNDNYYLVCSHPAFSDFTSYRIDRMSDVSLIDTPSSIPENLNQNVSRYRKNAFFMFASESHLRNLTGRQLLNERNF